MNPDTNRFEPLHTGTGRDPAREALAKLDALRREVEATADPSQLLRPDGSPVPKHRMVLEVGEDVVVKGYTFRVAHIGEAYLLLEPVGPVIVGQTHP